jgi:hypothetical protein
LYDRVIRALPLRTGVVIAVALATCGSAQAQGTAAQNRPAAPNSPPAATEAPTPVTPESTEASTEDATQALAVAAQNPIAAMYSLPFQNNTFFGVGPNHNQAANLLNIQPVLPFTVGDWNIISRTIAPLISLPSLTPGSLGDLIAGASSANDPFGLGDINQTFYFSPAAAKDFIWGVGPSVTLPTATTRALGSNTLAIGPAAVGLVTPKPWVIGTLVRQLWSVTGPNQNVDQTLFQPFVNYNLPEGWYLVTSPIITANWSAPSSQRWNVPLGGGVGKIFKIYGQPMNASLQAFDFVATPSLGPRWELRFQLQFLFPK